METLLCESKVINKNPKYRIIKYDSEYLMIDLASNWIVFFFPFINWLIPKTYVKITKNDYEKLNIVKPVKNKSIGWTIFAGIVLLGGTVRRNTYLFDFQLEELIVWSSCFIGFLEIIFFYFYLNKKLTLKIFNTNVVNKNRVVLIPTFKQGLLIVFAYFFLGSASIFTLIILLTTESQNIIIFLTWVIITMFFFLVNMASIGNKNVHVILRINE